MDIADLFMVLHRMTGQAFLVDGDVTGRVSVDFNRATLEEALGLLQKALEVRISEYVQSSTLIIVSRPITATIDS